MLVFRHPGRGCAFLHLQQHPALCDGGRCGTAKQLVVLDRPNPNGFYVDGPVLEPANSSFVGMHPVPLVHGMTMGEYAYMIDGEGWLSNKVRCDLQVITCRLTTTPCSTKPACAPFAEPAQHGGGLPLSLLGPFRRHAGQRGPWHHQALSDHRLSGMHSGRG
ncbi:MAG: DUF1343 domain-containing protein [Flavobacteriales bacterium]|nr:DUF1343 domain-containing protein [Flavobacteriales bacterium]